eukprot:CAMPEP_0178572246 /NCGR_PEP_ID=MMETSP0697-20121206/18113_1 /TAXON_ID=265572 /ORGANISM="Extubocellulus spinifer, Strain CCMP396" /LENGTH=108 /DNA_ID=CAMNT_0020206947 /DNA_START=116 /DNA_END=438 /DNA_ORIENTATION=-
MIGRFNLCALLVGFLFLAVACADEQQLRTRDLENIQEVEENAEFWGRELGKKKKKNKKKKKKSSSSSHSSSSSSKKSYSSSHSSSSKSGKGKGSSSSSSKSGYSYKSS